MTPAAVLRVKRLPMEESSLISGKNVRRKYE